MCIYLLKEISVNNTAAAGATANSIGKKVIFKNCTPFTNCPSKINNTQIDNAEYLDIVMPMYSLIEYEIPAVNNAGNIVASDGANATDSFDFKTKITG